MQPKVGLGRRLGAALGNDRFQSLLVPLAGTPILAVYLFRTLIGPIVWPGSDPVDFFEDYVATGKILATGGDPYTECMSRACWKGLTDAWSVYPPVVSWLSQPLWHLDHVTLAVGALLAAQSCVIVFVVAVSRGLMIRDWKAIGLVVMVTVSFPPLIDQVWQRNIEVVLLALGGLWFAGWVSGDRWWAGLALGAGLALKLVQAPLLLLGVWRGRPKLTATAIAGWAVLWSVGAANFLPEYLTRVLPAMNTGTGYAMDVAPVGAVARLLHPGSIFGQASGIDMTVRLIGAAIALAVVVMTLYVLRKPASTSMGKALEASAVVAASPLVLAVVRPGHLLLLLLPMVVVGTFAWRTRAPGIQLAVVVSWLLTGPVYLWYTNLIAAGFRGAFVEPGEETALVGVAILWAASLAATRRSSAAFSVSRSRSPVAVATAGAAAPGGSGG